MDISNIIKSAIKEAIKKLNYDFKNWWKYDFDTDIGIDEDTDIATELTEDEVDENKSDFIFSIADDVLWETCKLLGINTDKETKHNTYLIENIYEEVKNILWENLRFVEQYEFRVFYDGRYCVLHFYGESIDNAIEIFKKHIDTAKEYEILSVKKMCEE